MADLVEGTPADRDRYVDFLRAASILAVMAGHWVVAVIERSDGVVTGTNALASVGWLRWATWVMQVMPVFFFVGGFANLRAIEREERVGGTWRSYLQRRVDRLLLPTVVFAVVWLVLSGLLQIFGAEERTAHLAGRVASQPLWFLAVYVLVVALAPPMLALHRRAPWTAIAGLTGAMVMLDIVRFASDSDGVATANYAIVFLFAQQLGFAYGDGRLTRLRARRLLVVSAAAVAVLAALTTWGPYPLSMVGVPGEAVSNMSPPTVCIAVLTVAQVGVLMAARPAAQGWLAGRRVWAVTVAVNARIMTLFLWHLTALAAAAALLIEVGIAAPTPGSSMWWALRPVWLVSAACVLGVLVAVFGWAEDLRGDGLALPARPLWPAALGTLVLVRGLVGLALSGFDRALAAHGSSFAGVRLSPLVATSLVVAGWLLVRGRQVRTTASSAVDNNR